MFVHVVFITCCLLIPIHCCSEISSVLELPANNLANSVPLRADRIRKSPQVDVNGLKKGAVAASEHGSQHQHPSNERSAATSSIDTGTIPHSDDARLRRKHTRMKTIPAASAKQCQWFTGWPGGSVYTLCRNTTTVAGGSPRCFILEPSPRSELRPQWKMNVYSRSFSVCFVATAHVAQQDIDCTQVQVLQYQGQSSIRQTAAISTALLSRPFWRFHNRLSMVAL
jgi:hypothetical protein